MGVLQPYPVQKPSVQMINCARIAPTCVVSRLELAGSSLSEEHTNNRHQIDKRERAFPAAVQLSHPYR